MNTSSRTMFDKLCTMLGFHCSLPQCIVSHSILLCRLCPSLSTTHTDSTLPMHGGGDVCDYNGAHGIGIQILGKGQNGGGGSGDPSADGEAYGNGIQILGTGQNGGGGSGDPSADGGIGQNGGGGTGDPSADGGTFGSSGSALTRINEVACEQVGEDTLGCYAANDKIQLCLDELVAVETPVWEDICIDDDTAKLEQSAWDKISEYNQIGYDFFLPCDSHGWVGHPNSLMDAKSRRAPMLLSTMIVFTPPSLCLRPLACTFTLMDLLSFQITPCHGP